LYQAKGSAIRIKFISAAKTLMEHTEIPKLVLIRTYKEKHLVLEKRGGMNRLFPGPS